MFLVDVNVLSEATKPRPSQLALDWLDRNRSELSVNPIILGELEYGILRLPVSHNRTKLLDWFTAGLTRLSTWPIDRETGHVWAGLLARLVRKGRAMPVKDSLIAATALQHQLTVATRNTRDYKHAGVRLVNPFNS
ncbi:MAG TPA: type II toxin-antitoxin system VapC family toxin [Pirellulales bacterium]|jgi:predicted nucleic acid-binding protein|nr:type II toxin-antitoxin system VapC family toxin [Pirellulales bacterium]